MALDRAEIGRGELLGAQQRLRELGHDFRGPVEHEVAITPSTKPVAGAPVRTCATRSRACATSSTTASATTSAMYRLPSALAPYASRALVDSRDLMGWTLGLPAPSS